MRNRVIVILLFPVLTLIFMIGWILYIFGKQQTSPEKVPQRKPDGAAEDVESNKEGDVEVGLIEELTEEQLTSE